MSERQHHQDVIRELVSTGLLHPRPREPSMNQPICRFCDNIATLQCPTCFSAVCSNEHLIKCEETLAVIVEKENGETIKLVSHEVFEVCPRCIDEEIPQKQAQMYRTIANE